MMEICIHFKYMLVTGLLFPCKIVIYLSEKYALLIWFMRCNLDEFKQVYSSINRAILRLACTNIFPQGIQNIQRIYFN